MSVSRPPCKLPEPVPAPRGELLTKEEAMAAAAACLSLHTCYGCELCQLLCPDLAISKDPATGRPVIDLKYCKGCGLCAHVCPRGAISMEAEHPAD